MAPCLLHDDPVNMRVEGRHQQRRRDDGGEVQEDQVVVVHDLHEEAGEAARGAGVPAEQRQEAHGGPGHPAHADDHWKLEKKAVRDDTTIIIREAIEIHK